MATTAISALISIATSALKVVFEVAKNGILGLVTIVFFTFNNVFSFANYNLQTLGETVGREKFAYKPHPQECTSILSSIIAMITGLIQEIRTEIKSLIDSLVPIILLCPYLIIISIFFWIFSFGFQYYGFILLIAIDLGYKILKVVMALYSIPLNFLMTYFALGAVFWNFYMVALGKVWTLISHSICPGSFADGLSAACPIIDAWFTFLINYWMFLVNLVGVFWDFLVLIYTAIGNLLCPDGNCLGNLCKLAGHDPCAFDATVLVSYIMAFVNEWFDFYLAFLQLAAAFAGDLFSTIAFGVFAVTSLGGGTLAALNGKATTLLLHTNITADSPVKQIELEAIKTLFLSLEVLIFQLIKILVNQTLTFIILIDMVICSATKDIYQCLIAKVCFTILPGVGQLDSVCVAFGFRVAACPCDIAIYRDPGLPSLPATLFTPATPPLPPLVYFLIPTAASSRTACITVKSGAPRASCAVRSNVTDYNGGFTANIVPIIPTNSACQGSYPIVSNCMCVGDFKNIIIDSPVCYSNEYNVDVIYPAPGYIDYIIPSTIFTPKRPSGDGIWVPCVPGQNPCDLKYSLIPKFLRGA